MRTNAEKQKQQDCRARTSQKVIDCYRITVEQFIVILPVCVLQRREF